MFNLALLCFLIEYRGAFLIINDMSNNIQGKPNGDHDFCNKNS